MNKLIDIELADNDTLIETKEELIAIITEGRGTSLDTAINDLLEIERELTIREE